MKIKSLLNKGGCLGCKHFHIEPGYHYSDCTFEDFSAECTKNVFSNLIGEYGDVWYKTIFVDGSTCKKYGLADHAKD